MIKLVLFILLYRSFNIIYINNIFSNNIFFLSDNYKNEC